MDERKSVMEDNIPYGYNDKGELGITRIGGTSLGFRNFQTRKQNELREAKEWQDKIKDCPQTPEESNRWFINRRKYEDAS